MRNLGSTATTEMRREIVLQNGNLILWPERRAASCRILDLTVRLGRGARNRLARNKRRLRRHPPHSGRTVVHKRGHCTEITRVGVRPPRHRPVSVMSPCGHILTMRSKKVATGRRREPFDLAIPFDFGRNISAL
jgi:hypothetical protein